MDVVLSADLNQLQDWKRDIKLIGKPYSNLCMEVDKSIASDLVLGAWTRFQDQTTTASEAEVTWAALQLMMSRRTDRANLQALIDRLQDLMKTEPPAVRGVAFSLSKFAIEMDQHILDLPPDAKPPLPNNWVACHLREHPRPNLLPSQVIGPQSPRIQVLASIGQDGSVTRTKVITETSAALSKVASETVMRYKYDPIFVGGQAREVDTMVDVSFK